MPKAVEDRLAALEARVFPQPYVEPKVDVKVRRAELEAAIAGAQGLLERQVAEQEYVDAVAAAEVERTGGGDFAERAKAAAAANKRVTVDATLALIAGLEAELKALD